MKHIDDWLEHAVCSRDPGTRYAAFVLHHKRLSAVAQFAFSDFVGNLPLYCDYNGSRFRCTGASRLGDVWLATNHNRDYGYDHRVDVDDCSNWSNQPGGEYIARNAYRIVYDDGTQCGFVEHVPSENSVPVGGKIEIWRQVQ